VRPEKPVARELVQVVAGVLRDTRGRVLLAQRPDGKYLAGSWEFPGGKRERDETGLEALRRELAEELGISVRSARPWLALTHEYPEIDVRLQLYQVEDWRGEPKGREGQSLDWVTLSEMNERPMPAADRPIVRALGLDDRYAITPDSESPGGLQALMDWTRGNLKRGIRLFQLSARSLDEKALASLARHFGTLMKEGGARWLLNGPPELAAAIGADGVHLDRTRLRCLAERPLSDDFLVAASCHDRAELMRAGELSLDFVTVAPVRAIAGQPDMRPLGWSGFGQLSQYSPLPIYALGGIAMEDLQSVREHGGFGVAGTRAFGGQ